MDNPTIKDALKQASLILSNPKEAQILLSSHLQKDLLFLITHEKEIVPHINEYFRLVERRKNNEPIEYITHEVSFYSHLFYIAPGALIPRPETELLIDHVKEIIETFPPNQPLYISEIGVGSGIISIMLATMYQHLHITASDISPDALEIAKINAQKFGVSDRIRFVHTSYLEGVDERFDLIVSNPPYIKEGFTLEKPLDFEPQNALFGGTNGDEMLKKIIDIAITREVSYLLCEMGYDQKIPLHSYMKQKPIADFYFYQDYSGFDRGFVAKIKE